MKRLLFTFVYDDFVYTSNIHAQPGAGYNPNTYKITSSVAFAGLMLAPHNLSATTTPI